MCFDAAPVFRRRFLVLLVALLVPQALIRPWGSRTNFFATPESKSA